MDSLFDIEIDNCFSPNLTSKLVLKAMVDKLNFDCSILELGCGSGFISINFAKNKSKNFNLFASDICKKAVDTATKNYKDNDIICELKQSDGFKSWDNQKFDVVVSDVSAIDEKVANISKWYLNAPCKTGDGGYRIILRLISEVSEHLNKGGSFVFPLISLSSLDKIKDHLKSNNFIFEEIYLTEWPLPDYFHKFTKDLNLRKDKGYINFKEKFGKLICWTSVLIAHK